MFRTCHPSSTCSEPYVLVIITRRNMTVTAPTQQSNSYRTPWTFLPVILEWMIGSGWNLLREQRCSCRCCAWIIGRSLNRWRWVALVFNEQVYTALQDGIISQNLWPPRSPDLTSHGFFFFGATWRRECTGEKSRTIEALKDNIRLNITHTEKDVLQRTMDNMKLCVSDVSSGGRRPFWTLDVKSFSW